MKSRFKRDYVFYLSKVYIIRDFRINQTESLQNDFYTFYVSYSNLCFCISKIYCIKIICIGIYNPFFLASLIVFSIKIFQSCGLLSTYQLTIFSNISNCFLVQYLQAVTIASGALPKKDKLKDDVASLILPCHWIWKYRGIINY
jgi:hypothetical protein